MKRFNQLIFPGENYYSKSHLWIFRDAPHRVGITDYAQDQLGRVHYVELPGIGQLIGAGGVFSTLESAKSSSTLFLPVAGTVSAVNETLNDHPDLINQDPYDTGWLVEILPADPVQFDWLMDRDTYVQHLRDYG